MKFSDIIALAKQGYTPTDIKELMALSDNDMPEDTEQKMEQSANDTPQDNVEDTNNQDGDVDYKSLYEDAQKRNDELQHAMVNLDISGNVSNISDFDTFCDVVKNFM